MSVTTLLGHHWRRHRLTLMVLAVAMALFEWVITRVAVTGEQADRLRGFLELVPSQILSIVGEVTANLSPQGFVGFGFAHPFAVLMMSLWTVRVSAGALAGEIGVGTMDLVAARPVARASQVAAALVAAAGGLAIVIGAGWSGTAIGLMARPDLGLAAAALLPVVAQGWLLFLAFGAVGLAVSAGARSAGTAIGVTSGMIAASFALDYLARAWAPIRPLRAVALFRYYEPQAILRDGLAGADALVLAGVAVIGAIAAFVVFRRRDL